VLWPRRHRPLFIEVQGNTKRKELKGKKQKEQKTYTKTTYTLEPASAILQPETWL